MNEDVDTWPAELRDHPRVAVVDTTTGKVSSTWDRTTCGDIPGYAPPVDHAPWPDTRYVVLDATTGEFLSQDLPG
ncbi:hypothetical protein [Cellulomonas hominis]